ncbi:ABC transporter permease subunit [Ostreibacterium oceani]|uniref:ABC transporter permease subunit n=1 Tax=Ostreibacterium oceani TaxID=2654998 RepID=A0A6N7EWV3_9GAMM|nr:ABC transporter permease subunit [Ostreibacterium oceani]MPV85899.1 ABC transporter permease subunit [Ostreibacterium oceani]
MGAYFIRRLLLVIPTFIGITFLVFLITRLVPGGPLEELLQQIQLAGADGAGNSQTNSGETLSDEQLAELEQFFGLDQSIPQAYMAWMGKLLQLDFGVSTRFQDPVLTLIKERLPISLFYGIATLVIVYSVCIPLGIVKAIRHNTSFDYVSSILVFIGFAIPGYVIGILLLNTFAYYYDWLPLGGFVSDEFETLGFWGKVNDVFRHAVLPLIAYVAGSFAMLTLLMKNSLMENLAKDYMKTAIAKGLSFRQAVFRHALRNSLVPIATGFGGVLSVVLTGSFLIESIFNIDGIGLLGYESVVKRDYPVVMGILVISSLLYLLGNILSDICVALVDPRVKFD